MTGLVIVRLFSLYHVAQYLDGVMQYTVYGPYRSMRSARAACTRRGLTIVGELP